MTDFDDLQPDLDPPDMVMPPKSSRAVRVHVRRESDTESTSAALARVTAERDELAAKFEARGKEFADMFSQLNRAHAERDKVRDDLSNIDEIKAELANAARDTWIVARDGGRDCAACDHEIGRDMAYTHDPTTEEPIHIHCP